MELYDQQNNVDEGKQSKKAILGNQTYKQHTFKQHKEIRDEISICVFLDAFSATLGTRE